MYSKIHFASYYLFTNRHIFAGNPQPGLKQKHSIVFKSRNLISVIDVLYCGHPRDRELVSSIAGVYFSQTYVLYFCRGFSCCPYYRGVRNSEVSASSFCTWKCKSPFPETQFFWTYAMKNLGFIYKLCFNGDKLTFLSQAVQYELTKL